MTNEQKSILSIRIVAAIMTVLLGIGIGYLIWHDKPVQIVNKVDKVKVDSLQNVINTLTLQLNNIKEYKVKEKIIYKTQIVKEKEKIYQALDTAARVNVFQKWVVDSSGIPTNLHKSAIQALR
jgi:flagellar motor component MotA